MTTSCGVQDNACAADAGCVDLFECFKSCHPAYFTGGGDGSADTPEEQACDAKCTAPSGDTAAENNFNQLGDCVAACDSVCGSGG